MGYHTSPFPQLVLVESSSGLSEELFLCSIRSVLHAFIMSHPSDQGRTLFPWLTPSHLLRVCSDATLNALLSAPTHSLPGPLPLPYFSMNYHHLPLHRYFCFFSVLCFILLLIVTLRQSLCNQEHSQVILLP